MKRAGSSIGKVQLSALGKEDGNGVAPSGDGDGEKGGGKGFVEFCSIRIILKIFTSFHVDDDGVKKPKKTKSDKDDDFEDEEEDEELRDGKLRFAGEIDS